MKLKRSRREREKDVTPPVVVEQATITSTKYFGPDEPTLQLDCWEDELSPAQLEAYKKAEQEHNTVKSKFGAIIKDTGAQVVHSGDQIWGYTVSGNNQELNDLATTTTPVVAAVATNTSSSASVHSESPPPTKIHIGKKKGKKDKEKEKEKEKDPKFVAPPSPPSPEPKLKEGKKLRGREKGSKTASPGPTANVQSVSSGVRPSEASAIGGLATGSGSKSAIVDLTKDDSKNAPDSREVAFNKLQGKTFPSLVVVARPYLKTKDGSNTDRAVLDGKVKSVLMHSPTKFTEWLIQQGLVRSEQVCAVHPGTKLKLGIYSDVSKFPYSGGYVWISECCPTRFLSVFSGSLFEGATQPPSVLLKLIYHWACQTNVQNVVQWVKVDNLYVKGLFTWLRAACTAALHHHLTLIGGNGKKIEVGVISLGTTSHDGQQRQVKVEVLGILDPEAKLVRLRAVEPLADGERNYKKRFQKILEPLSQWVHLDSVILTDLTVDKGTLLQMGFKTVHQVSNIDPSSKNSNGNIMEYLRRIVPRMFQNTLSLLSRQIIQQFLDELVWREWYGTSPGQAFDNIVTHLAEQTRLEAKDNLVVRLNKISLNPFKNWKYSSSKAKGIPIMPTPSPEVPKESRRGRRKKEVSPIVVSPPSPPPPSLPPSPPPRRSHGGKETRKRKRVNYIEPDDDDDVVLMETKKEKRIKSKSEEKIVVVVEEKKLVKKFVKKFGDKKLVDKKLGDKKLGEKKFGEKKFGEKKFKEKFKIEKKEKRKDKEDLKISIKKDVKDEQMVDLCGYYFGMIENRSNIEEKQMLVQCTECSIEFSSSTELQLHLLLHVSPPADSSEGDFQCRYCLLNNSTAEQLADHLTSVHPIQVKSKSDTYSCMICELGFNSLSFLSGHMQKTHVHHELPYSCGICDYRISSHRMCIDHFYKDHKSSAVLQCPFCLKIVKVYADGIDLQSNVEFFIQHLQNHMNKSMSMKCGRCSLKFVHLGALKEHQVMNHITVPETKSLYNKEYLINKPKNKATPPVKDSANHLFVETFNNLNLVIPDGFICKECDSQLEEYRHFLGTYRCTKCTYQTCCWKSLLNHSGLCQSNKELGLAPLVLTNTMYCICSYSTDDGNALAQHLTYCERQTAYPTEEQAKMNTVAVPLTKESMMDSLCLQPNKESEYNQLQQQAESVPEYPAPESSVLNTQLSLDDLAPPSVLQHDQMELDLKNDSYEQPLATPKIIHEEIDVQAASVISEQSHNSPTASQSLDSYMDSTGEFEPLPAEPMPQPEFEPL